MCVGAGVAGSGLADGSTGIDVVGDILGGRQETRRNDAVRVQELFPLLSPSPWPLHVILHGGTEHGDMQEISLMAIIATALPLRTLLAFP